MITTPIRTPLVKRGDNLQTIITQSVSHLSENSILVIASKIVSFCENRFVKKVTGEREEKHQIAKQEAEYFINPIHSPYNMLLTIKGGWIFANAGIDESNAENEYILWPKDPQESVNQIWKFLKEHFRLRNVGVIMTDSKSMPLNQGVVGHGIAWCGFNPLRNYVGTLDLYGREMHMEKTNLVQGIAGAAVLVMGEGSEQTPLVVVEDMPGLTFVDHSPTEEDFRSVKTTVESDFYGPILTRAPWEPGGAAPEPALQEESTQSPPTPLL